MLKLPWPLFGRKLLLFWSHYYQVLSINVKKINKWNDTKIDYFNAIDTILWNLGTLRRNKLTDLPRGYVTYHSFKCMVMSKDYYSISIAIITLSVVRRTGTILDRSDYRIPPNRVVRGRLGNKININLANFRRHTSGYLSINFALHSGYALGFESFNSISKSPRGHTHGIQNGI